LIVGDGPLQFLPFGALPLPDSGGEAPLLSRHEVIQLPSFSVLAALRREREGRRIAPRTLAVIADPVYSRDDVRTDLAAARMTASAQRDVRRGEESVSAQVEPELAETLRGGPEFRRLIFSRHEAKAILSLAPPGQSWAALDFDANVSAATGQELASARIAHFAVHGVLDTVRPALSALVFSLVDRNGNEKDGFLRLHDIYNLKLPAELVVLSACSSAIGKDIRGEGLASLMRGFMYAGAPRVIASLWQVDDEATSELMKSLYQKILGKAHLSPAAALREAQLRIMAEPRWRDPYYWAAFTFFGDWQ
jgi:CHAT domain-containing protein